MRDGVRWSLHACAVLALAACSQALIDADVEDAMPAYLIFFGSGVAGGLVVGRWWALGVPFVVWVALGLAKPDGELSGVVVLVTIITAPLQGRRRSSGGHPATPRGSQLPHAHSCPTERDPVNAFASHRPGRAGMIVARTLTALAYCALWAAFLSSDLIEVPFDPAVVIAFFLGIQLALGHVAGTPWALALCVFPALFALCFPGAIPPDPDIPDYSALVAITLLVLGTPAGAALTWAGAHFRVRRNMDADGSAPSVRS